MSIIQRMPWTVQPQIVPRVASWVPPGTAIYIGTNVIVGSDPLAALAAPTSITQAPYIGGMSIVGTASTSRQPIGNLDMADAASGLTLIAQFVSSTTFTRYVEGNVSTGTSYIEDFGINLDATEASSAGKTMFFLRNSSGGTVSQAGSTSAVLVQNKLHTAVWQWAGAGNFSLWLDGVSIPVTVSNSAFTGTNTGNTEFPITLLNRNVRNAFSGGGSGLNLGLFARILSTNVPAQEISRNPWGALFAPRQRRIWAPSAGAAPTGTFNPYFYHEHIAGTMHV